MSDHFFISYSRIEPSDFTLKLADELAAGPPAVPVWVDKRHVRPGEDWDEQIEEAIRTCKGMIFVMTKDSVDPLSVCKDEWVRALKYKKPIIPLLLSREAELPFRLSSLHYIDFTEDFDTALASLRKHLSWMDSPEGHLKALKYRLADAWRELPRAEPEQRARIQEEIQDLQQQINDQQRQIDDPEGAKRGTEARIAKGLEHERQPDRPDDMELHSKFINTPPAVAPSYFQDRHVETKIIADFLKDDALRLMTVVGRAGIGKTAMVCRLLKALESGRLPDDGGPLSVDGIVYLCSTGLRRVSLAHLYEDLCRLLPESSARLLDAVYRNAQASIEAKMQALLEAFPGGRTVVLLDNFEDVVDIQNGEIRESELDEALRALLKLPQHGIKVILTSGVAPHSLQLFQPGRQMKIELGKGLESPYAENILRGMDRDGKIGLRDAPDGLLALARERTRGFPRALEALFAILSADRDTTLQEVLSDVQRPLPENVVEDLVGEAFSRLDSMAQRVMQALAVYTYPVPPPAVDYLLQPYLPGIDNAPVLRRLVNMQFARAEEGYYYLHHVDRAYALSRVPDGQPSDWQIPEETLYTRSSLQHRGAEYFRQVRRDESTWKSLKDLSPLIAEFDLLSISGDYESALEVLATMLPFLERWGHYRQVARLAEKLSREVEKPVGSIALGLEGWAYFVLGELAKAIECLKAALEAPISVVKPEQTISWRLDLARCYAAQGNHTAAATEYRHVLEDAQADVGSQVTALLGLGLAAEAQNLHDEAEKNYRQALHIYVPQLTVQVLEDGKFVLSPNPLTPDASIANPRAWHPLDRVIPVEGAETSEVLYLFGVETAAVDADAPNSTDASSSREETGTSVEVLRVRVTDNLADIWMSFANLYARTDRLSGAEGCCRLAMAMYGAMKSDLGVARALNLLGRIVGQFSDAEAEAILTAQEEELKRARASGHRRFENALLDGLAETYLGRGKVDKAEELYFKLSHHAAELEDDSLRIQADIGLASIEWVRRNLDVAVANLENLLKGSILDLQLQNDVLMMLSRVELSRGNRIAAMQHADAASRGYAEFGSLMGQIEAERLLADIAMGQRDYDESVRRCGTALQLAKSTGIPSLVTSVLSDLANAYLSAGAREKAMTTADEAYKTTFDIELPGTAAKALMTIGEIATDQQNYELAERSYKQAKDTYQRIGNVKNQISALHGLCYLYGRSEQRELEIDVARQEWKLANELDDPGVKQLAQSELAMALSDCNLHEEAIQNMQEVVDNDPQNAENRGGLGWVLYQAGEYDRSLAESARALEIDPAQTWTIRNLGNAYLAKGFPDDAEREYRRAIQDRKGGENFIETIRVVKKLFSQRPDLPRGREMLQLLEEEQQKLDAEEKFSDGIGPS
jgi:tetratricopeptide (TPR) repeat protein